MDRRDAEKALRAIDAVIASQLAVILADPGFRRLEASWRGLRHLVSTIEPGANVRVRFLSVKKGDVLKDFERSGELERSALWQTLVEEPFRAFGEPLYGLLLGDFEFSAHPQETAMLRLLAGVAEGAGAPLVAGAAPELFGVAAFEELASVRDLPALFQRTEYAAWRSFRESGGGASCTGASFVALAAPGVWLRRGWSHADLFGNRAGVPAGSVDGPLRGSPAWAWAICVVRAFSNEGWFSGIRGAEGGTSDLPPEVALDGVRERTLSGLGIVPLVWPAETGEAAFLGSSSCAKPRRFETDLLTRTGNCSCDLAHVLSCLRFVQSARALYRDRAPAGTGWTGTQARRALSGWLSGYVSEGPCSPEESARKPLHEALLHVEEIPGSPGSLRAAFFLGADHELEPPAAALRIATILRPRPA